MKFQRKSDNHEASDCGRYTVSAYPLHEGHPLGNAGYAFNAWRLQKPTSIPIGGPVLNAEAARELCRADAAERAKG